MSKVRNPDAICATCPYWYHEKDDEGQCRRYPMANVQALEPTFPRYLGNDLDVYRYYSEEEWTTRYQDDWCGEHPDFFAEPKASEPETPKCRCGGSTEWRQVPSLNKEKPNEIWVQWFCVECGAEIGDPVKYA